MEEICDRLILSVGCLCGSVFLCNRSRSELDLSHFPEQVMIPDFGLACNQSLQQLYAA